MSIVVFCIAGDSCCNPLSLGSIQTLIEKHIEGIYVHSLQFGSSFAEVTYVCFVRIHFHLPYCICTVTRDHIMVVLEQYQVSYPLQSIVGSCRYLVAEARISRFLNCEN